MNLQEAIRNQLIEADRQESEYKKLSLSKMIRQDSRFKLYTKISSNDGNLRDVGYIYKNELPLTICIFSDSKFGSYYKYLSHHIHLDEYITHSPNSHINNIDLEKFNNTINDHKEEYEKVHDLIFKWGHVYNLGESSFGFSEHEYEVAIEDMCKKLDKYISVFHNFVDTYYYTDTKNSEVLHESEKRELAELEKEIAEDEEELDNMKKSDRNYYDELDDLSQEKTRRDKLKDKETLTESITNYTLNDDERFGRDEADVYISCYVSGTEEGRLLCIIPCKWNESSNRFEPSINDINFMHPSDGDEANPNDVDLQEIIDKIPNKILNNLYALKDPDIAAQEYEEQEHQRIQNELQELIKILKDIGVDYSKFNEEQLVIMRDNIVSGKQLGFSDNILKSLATPKIYSSEHFMKSLNNCLLLNIPEQDILEALSKSASGKYTFENTPLDLLCCNLLEDKYNLKYQEPGFILLYEYIKMILDGVPVEFLQSLEKKCNGNPYKLCNFLHLYYYENVPYDMIKYISENIKDFVEYDDEFENIVRHDDALTKENIDLFNKLLNKYPELNRAYKDYHYYEIYSAERLLLDICKGCPVDMCILKIEEPGLFEDIDRYYKKGLSIESMKTILNTIRGNARITDSRGAFRRACNKLLKTK